MKKDIMPQRKKQFGYRAQAMVEFAIALPVLLAILIGIMEISRMMLMYALVVNASRDAVRYASAVGRGADGLFVYKNCAGIKTAANQSTYKLVTLSSISISYKDENGNSAGVCDQGSGEDPDITVDTNYRVTVSVAANYAPMVKFLPIKTKPFTAVSTRTFLGIYDLPNP